MRETLRSTWALLAALVVVLVACDPTRGHVLPDNSASGHGGR